MALSKFFTYSAYILRKGVSFCRMSPMRGVDALQGGRGEGGQGSLDLKSLLQRSRVLLSAQRENVNAAECLRFRTLLHSFTFHSPPKAHHSPMRFSKSGSRNWLWKVWMEEMLEKMFFTTSTGNVPLFASSISLRQKT